MGRLEGDQWVLEEDIKALLALRITTWLLWNEELSWPNQFLQGNSTFSQSPGSRATGLVN